MQITGGGTTTRFQYDGIDLVAEYSATNVLLRRYVHGPGTDNPIVWYEGTAVSNTTRRFLMADERGSIVSVTDSAGATIVTNRYDEYGIPASTNLGRFQYTGQTWLAEVGLYHYKARMYSPTLGRFMQTDPIGYADGMNWYAYVGRDPINFVDPLGLDKFDNRDNANPICPPGDPCTWAKIDKFGDYVVTGRSSGRQDPQQGNGFTGAGGDRGGGGEGGGGTGRDIVVTARRIVRTRPPGARTCRAGGFTFPAPSDFRPGDIVRSGFNWGLPGAYFYVGTGAEFDFQRPDDSVFYRQYTAVSNLAVGLYLAGAQMYRGVADFISDTYASHFSSNGATAEQDAFRNLGFDIYEGRTELRCDAN